MALHLVAQEVGPEIAQAVQLGIEYDPDPPFDCRLPGEGAARDRRAGQRRSPPAGDRPSRQRERAPAPPRALAAHRLGPALQPVGLEVVVVGAGGVAGLAGEHLPARAVGVGRVGDHPPARRPDRFVGVVGVVGDLADRLLGAAGPQAAVEQPAQQRVGLAERVRELHLVDLAPAPALGVGAEALLEVVEGAGQGFQHELVPGAADQLLVAFLPERHQVRVPAPGRGDVGREAVVGAVEPALAEVAVADRRARHLAGQAQQEGLVDRAGDRLAGRAGRPSCAAARSRCARAGRAASAGPGAAPPRARAARGCRSASPRSSRGRARRSRRAAARSAWRGSRRATRW